LTLPPSGPDSEQLGLWNETPTVNECSPDTGPACRSGPTYATSRSTLFSTPTIADSKGVGYQYNGHAKGAKGITLTLTGQVRSDFSPEVSPASPIALQENVRRLVMSVIYGASAPGSQMSLDPAGASLKTCRDYFRANAAASSPAWSVTWPRWGIASDGVFGELATLEHRTAANESSSWPTPVASTNRKSANAMQSSIGTGIRRSSPPGLEQAVELAAGIIPKELEGMHPSNLPPRLREMWPTPSATDHKGSVTGEKLEQRRAMTRGVRLAEEVAREAPTIGGSLNPTWIEWLMGFPLGWTDLEPSGTP
jgi:hypothetical protein